MCQNRPIFGIFDELLSTQNVTSVGSLAMLNETFSVIFKHRARQPHGRSEMYRMARWSILDSLSVFRMKSRSTKAVEGLTISSEETVRVIGAASNRRTKGLR